MPKMTFIDRDGARYEVEARAGTSVMQIAKDNDIDIEGACEGSLACATCHVVVDRDWFGRLNAAQDEEIDMLDLAPALEPTSRLGCQVPLTDALDGLVVKLPAIKP